MIERVIAVDPGKTTGLCVIERVRTPDSHTVRLLGSWETTETETVPKLRELMAQYGEPAEAGSPRARIAMESFRITVRTGEKSQEASTALETIGAVKQVCRDLDYPVDAIFFSAPANKAAFPNPKLKKLGLWHTGGAGHALDAIRHGLIYLTQTGLIETQNPV